MSNRYESVDAWRAKALELFGDFFKTRFKCPACGNVASPEDFRRFKEQGATPNSAAQECIGRYTGRRSGPNKCDWAAYGLFRGPDVVVHEDGVEVWVFPFDTG